MREDFEAIAPLQEKLAQQQVRIAELEFLHAQHKHTEEELIRQKDFAEAIFDTAQAIVLVLDLKGCIVRFNRYMEQLSGYGLEEVKGKDWFSTFLVPEDSQTVKDIFQDSTHGVRSKGNVNAIVTKDGQQLFIEWYDEMLRDHSGNAVGILAVGQDITERKRSEEALRESEERLRSLFETAPDIILSVDRRGTIQSINRTLQGYTVEGTIGTSVFDYVATGKNRQIVRAALNEVITTKQPTAYEMEIDGLAGQNSMWFSCRLSPLLKGGEVAGATVISTDVTKRKRAEKSLQNYQKELEILNRIASAFLTISDENIYSEVLSLILKELESDYGVFGYIDEKGDLACPSISRETWEKSKISGKEIVFRRDMWPGMWGRALREKRSFITNEGLRVPMGHVRIKRALAVPIIYHDGLVGLLMVANREKVYSGRNRKLLEEIANQIAPILNARLDRDRKDRARQRAEEALREAKDKLASTLSSLDDLVFTLDKDGIFRECYEPDTPQRLFHKADEFIGRSYQDVLSEYVASLLDNAIKKLKKTKKSQQFDYLFEWEDQKLYFNAKVSPRKGRDGRFAGVTIVSRNITKRKHIEAKLERAKQVAESASRAKSNFLANMSHEIRTPLTAIVGFSQMLADPNQEDRVECIEKINRNAKFLSQLIQDILDLSKIEAGVTEVQRRPFSLVDELADTISQLKDQAEEKSLRLCVTFAGSLPQTIVTDRTRLRQILLNVIGNAIKFTDVGGIDVKVGLTKPEKETPINLLSFIVKDTGIGLSESGSEKVFQLFYQEDSSTTRRFGGAGLGLSLSKHLARALGGDVQLLESQPGQGSTFEITIDPGPLHEVKTILLRDERELFGCGDDLLSTEETARVLDGLNVLLAEDDPDLQVLFSRILDMNGASVDVASDGAEAVMKASAHPYDAILMDIQMPVMDGYEATTTLRTQGYEKPIVALTARLTLEERKKCYQVGCTDCLAKPTEHQALVQFMRQFVNNPEGRVPHASQLARRPVTEIRVEH